MKWILIVTIFKLSSFGVEGSPAVTMQEFDSEQACESSRDYIKGQIPPIDNYSNAVCYPKNIFSTKGNIN